MVLTFDFITKNKQIFSIVQKNIATLMSYWIMKMQNKTVTDLTEFYLNQKMMRKIAKYIRISRN